MHQRVMCIAYMWYALYMSPICSMPDKYRLHKWSSPKMSQNQIMRFKYDKKGINQTCIIIIDIMSQACEK